MLAPYRPEESVLSPHHDLQLAFPTRANYYIILLGSSNYHIPIPNQNRPIKLPFKDQHRWQPEMRQHYLNFSLYFSLILLESPHTSAVIVADWLWWLDLFWIDFSIFLLILFWVAPHLCCNCRRLTLMAWFIWVDFSILLLILFFWSRPTPLLFSQTDSDGLLVRCPNFFTPSL